MASGRIVIPSFMPAVDFNGFPIPGARIFVYTNRTTTLATIYADEALSIPLANPVISDSSGQFVPIWQDNALLFSVAVEGDDGVLTTQDDLEPSTSVGGAANKLDRDGGNSEPLFLDNVNAIARDGSNFAPSDGTDPSEAQAFRFATGDRSLRPEDYFDGTYTYGNAGSDWTNAINAMEADANPGDICRFNQGPYRITAPLHFARQNMCWIGNQTVFYYNPASAGVDNINLRQDILWFGTFDPNFPTTGAGQQLTNCIFDGFTVKAASQMLTPYANDADRPLSTDAAGYRYSSGVRFDNVVRSKCTRLFPDGQTDNGNLYNALFFNCIDQVSVTETVPRGANRATGVGWGAGITVVGQDSTALGAGLFLDDYKIGGSAIGVLIGGGFGGVYFGKGDIAGNGVNVAVLDNTSGRVGDVVGGARIAGRPTGLVSEVNREVLFSSQCSLDFSSDADLSSVLVDSVAGNLYVGFSNTWVASSAGHGVWIKRGNGCRVKAFLYCYLNAKDGLRVDDFQARVHFGGEFTDNGSPPGASPYWAVNPTAANHAVTGIATFINNGAGGVANINPTYETTFPQTALAIQAQRYNLDSAAKWSLVGGDPTFEFDANDFIQHDRSIDVLSTVVGSNFMQRVSPSGTIFQMNNGAFLPSVNGEATFIKASDTQFQLVMRGNDGVTRFKNITLDNT